MRWRRIRDRGFLLFILGWFGVVDLFYYRAKLVFVLRVVLLVDLGIDGGDFYFWRVFLVIVC